MQVIHVCGHEAHWQTNWRITAVGCSRRRWCFFFFLTDVALTFQQCLATGPKLFTSCIHSLGHLHTNQVSTFTQRPRLQNCPDYICSLHQTPVFYIPLSYSVLPSPQSASLSSLQEPAKLHCHVTLTSQLEWHTSYNLTTRKFQH